MVFTSLALSPTGLHVQLTKSEHLRIARLYHAGPIVKYKTKVDFFAFNFQMCAALNCGQHEHSLNGQKCCQQCGPGTGVHAPCTPANNTICHPCRMGESYSEDWSHIETCRPCRICPHYSHTKHMCNLTHDTICECDKNYYFETNVGGCRPCESCPMGYGVKRQCNSTVNTVCWQCPAGTYSDRRSNQGCRVCTLCGANQLMLQMCNSMQDTVCVGEWQMSQVHTLCKSPCPTEVDEGIKFSSYRIP